MFHTTQFSPHHQPPPQEKNSRSRLLNYRSIAVSLPPPPPRPPPSSQPATNRFSWQIIDITQLIICLLTISCSIVNSLLCSRIIVTTSKYISSHYNYNMLLPRTASCWLWSLLLYFEVLRSTTLQQLATVIVESVTSLLPTPLSINSLKVRALHFRAAL